MTTTKETRSDVAAPGREDGTAALNTAAVPPQILPARAGNVKT